MVRSRRPVRRPSISSNSSSSTSPERNPDDDGDSFMLQANDSQSSLGIDGTSESLSEDESQRREYEERCRVSPVHRLPAELLISVFSRLSSTKDLLTCMLVSQDWARNSVGLLWHRPAMGKWEGIHNVVQSLRKSDKAFAYPDLVKRLNMSTLASQVSDGTLIGMIDCKRVERLTLTNCTKLTDISLVPLIEGNRSLLALDITGLDQVTDRTMMVVADNCLRLQGLNVTNCKKLTDPSIMAIAKNCRHLKRLKFNGCIQLTDSAILTIADHARHLLEVDLYGLQGLESPAITALLTQCPHLREMRLAHCSRLDDSAFLNLPNDPEMPISFESLRILDLTDCGELGDKGVERIIQTCPRLRNLILAKCRQITDRSVFAITKLGKNLHYIHLGHCARITDASVEALAKACNRIRYIDLACCSNLTDQSVVKLAGLPKLKRIGLVKCAGITDASIFSLAMGEIPSRGHRKMHNISVLERVHLSYCTMLTLDGIHALLNNCPKLTHLSLTGVQAFLREDLLAFCRDAPPEFNEHQRDVFCVFSGTGVSRLREHLNHTQLFLQAQQNAAEAEDARSIDNDDFDDAHTISGGNTPTVLSVDVLSTHPPGATPVVGTGGVYWTGVLPPGPGIINFPPAWGIPMVVPHTQSALSQQLALQQGAMHPLTPPVTLPSGAVLGGPAGPAAATAGVGVQTQAVVGMMGGVGLDDEVEEEEVLEGDEAFGEGVDGEERMGD